MFSLWLMVLWLWSIFVFYCCCNKYHKLSDSNKQKFILIPLKGKSLK